MGITLGNLATVIFCIASLAFVIIAHDFVVTLTAPDPSKIVVPSHYERPVSPYRMIPGVLLILLIMLTIGVSGYYSHRAISEKAQDASEPKYCFIGTNGITEDHGVAHFINAITIQHDGNGEPVGLVVMFTRFLVHTPVITSVDSNIYEVTSTRDDFAHVFNFTFQIMHSIPRKGPFLIKMEITN